MGEGAQRGLSQAHERDASNRDIPATCSSTHSVSSLGDVLAAADGCKCQVTNTMLQSSEEPLSIIIQPECEQIRPRSPGQWAGLLGSVSLRGSSRAGWGPETSAARWA